MAAESLAAQLAQASPDAMDQTKRLLQAPWSHALEAAMLREFRQFKTHMGTPSFRAAVSAFATRRKSAKPKPKL